jgi:hypothetical protein
MTIGSGFGIHGVGASVPDEVRTNAWWPASFRDQFAARRGGDMTTPDTKQAAAAAASPELRIQLAEMSTTDQDPFRGTVTRCTAHIRRRGSSS